MARQADTLPVTSLFSLTVVEEGRGGVAGKPTQIIGVTVGLKLKQRAGPVAGWLRSVKDSFDEDEIVLFGLVRFLSVYRR